MSVDHQEVMLLVLLDLSAAFYTIDHEILLNFLQNNFGIIGSAHDWFASYLSNRKQCVHIDAGISDDFHLNCGVPQGSCLGPVLFYNFVYFVSCRKLPSQKQNCWSKHLMIKNKVCSHTWQSNHSQCIIPSSHGKGF